MKILSRDEMKNVMGGLRPSGGKECSANCNPGFVTISDCGDSTCTATEDEGVSCGSLKQCCPGFTC